MWSACRPSVGCACLGGLDQRLDVAERRSLKHPRLSRHQFGETLGAVDLLRLGVGGIGDELDQGGVVLRLALDRALSVPVRDPDRAGELSVAIEAEVEVIGKDDRVKRGLVAVELLLVAGALLAVEIVVANALRLDIEDANSVLVLDNEIWCAAIGALGLVDRLKPRRERIEKRGECTAESVFRGIA